MNPNPNFNRPQHRRSPAMTLPNPSTLPPDPFPDWKPETEVHDNHGRGMARACESGRVVSDIRRQQPKAFRSRSHGSKEDINRRMVHMSREMYELLKKIQRLEKALNIRFWNRNREDNDCLLSAIHLELCAFHIKLAATMDSVGDQRLMADFYFVLMETRRRKFSLWNALFCDLTNTIKTVGEHLDVLGENFYGLMADAEAYAAASKSH
ncbi:uncharacterized protein LOC62_03G005152 [Vanrija pseudolonga]|uniref:Uncharacterized protein n=1 Tax=Vanrija pseudolonga TaxID=143232 RepID=A0AAF1BM40_9TREE|nr:hypothetical protein LOC62_03G005152 [Vanrija pseudolonga]